MRTHPRPSPPLCFAPLRSQPLTLSLTMTTTHHHCRHDQTEAQPGQQPQNNERPGHARIHSTLTFAIGIDYSALTFIWLVHYSFASTVEIWPVSCDLWPHCDCCLMSILLLAVNVPTGNVQHSTAYVAHFTYENAHSRQILPNKIVI